MTQRVEVEYSTGIVAVHDARRFQVSSDHLRSTHSPRSGPQLRGLSSINDRCGIRPVHCHPQHADGAMCVLWQPLANQSGKVEAERQHVAPAPLAVRGLDRHRRRIGIEVKAHRRQTGEFALAQPGVSCGHVKHGSVWPADAAERFAGSRRFDQPAELIGRERAAFASHVSLCIQRLQVRQRVVVGAMIAHQPSAECLRCRQVAIARGDADSRRARFPFVSPPCDRLQVVLSSGLDRSTLEAPVPDRVAAHSEATSDLSVVSCGPFHDRPRLCRTNAGTSRVGKPLSDARSRKIANAAESTTVEQVPDSHNGQLDMLVTTSLGMQMASIVREMFGQWSIALIFKRVAGAGLTHLGPSEQRSAHHFRGLTIRGECHTLGFAVGVVNRRVPLVRLHAAAVAVIRERREDESAAKFEPREPLALAFDDLCSVRNRSRVLLLKESRHGSPTFRVARMVYGLAGPKQQGHCPDRLCSGGIENFGTPLPDV